MSENEINAIKSFLENYREIELHKIDVGMNSNPDDHEVISYATEEKVLKKTNRIIKVNLTSPGFAMLAKTTYTKILGREICLINKNHPLHSQS